MLADCPSTAAPARRTPAPPSSGGFTLIELLIAIVLLGVLTAVAVPAMSDFIARKRVQGAADQLMADLRYAQSTRQISPTDVLLRFQSNDDLTCYVMFTGSENGYACNCLRSRCSDGVQVLRQEVYPRSAGLEVLTDDDVRGIRLMGATGKPVDLGTDAYAERTSPLLSLSVRVQSERGGGVKVLTNGAFVPRVCSVTGHHSSYGACE